jgi:hypothetical protein
VVEQRPFKPFFRWRHDLPRRVETRQAIAISITSQLGRMPACVRACLIWSIELTPELTPDFAPTISHNPFMGTCRWAARTNLGSAENRAQEMMCSAELCQYWPTPARPVIAKMWLDNSVSSSRSDNRRTPSKGRRVPHCYEFVVSRAGEAYDSRARGPNPEVTMNSARIFGRTRAAG